MIRLLVFLLTGVWWKPPTKPPVCLKAECRALRSGCSSGFCLVHCADSKSCLCGVGMSAMLSLNELAAGDDLTRDVRKLVAGGGS